MSPTFPAWTSPQRLRLGGELATGQEDLRIGDEIVVTINDRKWVCVVVEISRKDEWLPVRWRAEAKTVIEGRA